MLHSLIHVHILGAYVQICVRYEVPVIKLWLGGLSTDNDNANDAT